MYFKFDERYCILMGGYGKDMNDQLSMIHVWDLEKMIFYESDIKLPKGSCFAVSVYHEKSDILSRGYLREMNHRLDMNIPEELVGLIMIYHRTEQIHVMNRLWGHQHYHFKMDVNDVLNSIINEDH